MDCPIKERNFIGDRVRAEGKGLGIISLGVLAQIDNEWRMVSRQKRIYSEREDHRNQIESLTDGPRHVKSVITSRISGHWGLVCEICRVIADNFVG